MFSIHRRKQPKMDKPKEGSIELLKKLLLSRDVQNQLKAVSFISETLEENRPDQKGLREYYINHDICIFLCEATATLHEHLLKNIMHCMNIFSVEKLFYKTSVSPHVVSSLVRTTHFLIKEDRLEEIVLNIMHLLSEIFLKNNKFGLPSVLSMESAHNAITLFELQCLIFKQTNASLDTKMITSLILHTVLADANKISIPPATAVLLVQVVSDNLNMLSQFLIDSNYDSNIKHKLDCVFGMICHLILDIHDLCYEGQGVKYKFKMDSAVKKQFQEISFNATINLVSELKDLPSAAVVPNYDLFLNMLYKCLQLYKTDAPIVELSNHLCTNNFLIFLAKLQTSNFSNKVTKLCQKTLLQLLYILSSENFNLEKWPGGNTSFFNHLNEGLQIISCEEWIRWPELLNNSNASSAVKNYVIIYLYFYCLNSKCPQNVATSLLPYLLNYVLSFQPHVKINCLIAKCLWFIFALADLSNVKRSQTDPHILYLNKAIDKVANLVSANIKDLYTHHPALVVWVFSSNRIPRNVQNKVLGFWLEKEKSLPSGLESIDSVWCSLLEIVQTGPRNIMSIATEQLKICIENYGNDKSMDYIKAILWDTLPDTLNSFCLQTSPISEETIMCLMKLCSTNIPKNPELMTIQKTGFSLVHFVSRCKIFDSQSGLCLLNEAFCLLEASLNQSDCIVLSQFINSPKFLQRVYDFCKSENELLSIEAIRFMSCLSHYLTQYNLEISLSIKFDPLIILKYFRDSNNSYKIISLLQLLYSIINPQNSFDKLPLISLHPENSSVQNETIFRSFFFRIQMLVCKDIKKESNNALLCLNRMLEFASKQSDENDLIIQLTLQPWTHMLIRYYFSNNPPNKIHINMLKFIYHWLNCFKIISRNWKLEINESNKKFIEDDLMCGTILNILKTFDKEDVIQFFGDEKKAIVNNIINLISSFII